ncbi:MAG: DUF512 domain-containing protein [Thermoleophilia bacterium]
MASVDPGSPADLAGVIPGDRILTLDGHRLRDVIDYQFRAEAGRQEVRLERDGEALELEIDSRDDPLPGICFANTLFDGVRQCRCNCAFCFVDQVPPGLRDALYLKDDDYRLSFLHGNFITLNNLEPGDFERIVEQRLSPLYVSVHVTDPDVRARLMGCSPGFARAGLDNLRRLGREGIATHIQVVLCPGVNDGAVLERTVAELAADYPGVGSVGIVPVAVDERGAVVKGPAPVVLRPPSVDECRRVVAAVAAWQERFRRERGSGFVYAADEFYLRAGVPLPPIDDYDDFPQYENGIGIAASFRQEVGELLQEQREAAPGGGRLYLLTGTLARPFLEETLRLVAAAAPPWPGAADFAILPAVNHLFGPQVTVTGLLGGRDIITAVREAGLQREDGILLPAAALDSAGERFLDGLTLEELDEILDCVIRVV